MVNRKAGVVLALLLAYMTVIIFSYQYYGDAFYFVRPSYSSSSPPPQRSWSALLQCIKRKDANSSSLTVWNETTDSLAANSSNSSFLFSNGTYMNTTHVCTEIPATITLFTTFQNSPAKEFIYRNTIRNWGLLRPYVKPIFYHIPGNLELTEFAREHGWEVYQVPIVSKHNVPVLRHMFLHAQGVSNTSFYGYANGDIMFDDGFIPTFDCLKKNIQLLKKVLVVGQRTNYEIGTNEIATSLKWVKTLGPKGKLFNANAQDYFISTRNGYPWDSIADFVVGRVGYDNWLVVNAITSNIPVIDTTKTMLALHQTGKDGNFAGHIKKSSGDTYVNYAFAGKKFSYTLGFTTCSHMNTEWEGSDVKLKHRLKTDPYCGKQYKDKKKDPSVFFKWKLLRR